MATISKLGRRERQGCTTQEQEVEGADRGLVLREGILEQRKKHRRHGVPSGVSARARMTLLRYHSRPRPGLTHACLGLVVLPVPFPVDGRVPQFHDQKPATNTTQGPAQPPQVGRPVRPG